MKPRARTRGLLVRELEGELLVYDRKAHRAHRLNRSAAVVFEASDGGTSVADLAARLRRDLGAPADERWVRLALGQLGKAGLLENDPTATENARRISRRDLMRRGGRVASVALLLPMVTSIVAPTPAEAAATCLTDCSGPQPFGTACYFSNASDCGVVCICDGNGNCVLVSDGVTACP